MFAKDFLSFNLLILISLLLLLNVDIPLKTAIANLNIRYFIIYTIWNNAQNIYTIWNKARGGGIAIQMLIIYFLYE